MTCAVLAVRWLEDPRIRDRGSDRRRGVSSFADREADAGCLWHRWTVARHAACRCIYGRKACSHVYSASSFLLSCVMCTHSNTIREPNPSRCGSPQVMSSRYYFLRQLEHEFIRIHIVNHFRYKLQRSEERIRAVASTNNWYGAEIVRFETLRCSYSAWASSLLYYTCRVGISERPSR